MKVALVSSENKNGNIEFNYHKIIDHSIHAKDEGADLVCFSSSFLQGPLSLTYDYEKDKEIALSIDNIIFKELAEFASSMQIAIAFGFYEKDKDNIFSTYLIIDKQGVITDQYRQVTRNWKTDDKRYKDGLLVYSVSYLNTSIVNLIDTDFFDDYYLEKVLTIRPNLVICPVYFDNNKEELMEKEHSFFQRMVKLKTSVALVNCISLDENNDKISLGGCLYLNKLIKNKQKLKYGKEGILFVQI